jgi:hypothetical protein
VTAASADLGPTLPALLGPRAWRPLRIALLVLVALAAGLALSTRSGETVLVTRSPVAFNFVSSAPLRPAGPAAVVQRRGGLLVQSLTAAPLRLARYRGDPAGTLPIVAERLEERLAARWAGFEVGDEGRARINDSPGYSVGWTARQGARRIFGRDYLLLPGVPGARSGAHLELLATYAAGVSRIADVGRIGALKGALRSFRFGTERP